MDYVQVTYAVQERLIGYGSFSTALDREVSLWFDVLPQC